MAARDILKYFNVFVDGRGYAGECEEFNPPKLALKMEDFRSGAMTNPIEIELGEEKLESDFSLISYSRQIIALYGLHRGANIAVTMRGSMESTDGVLTPIVHNMRGIIKEVDSGTSKAGDKPALKISLAVRYYKLSHGGSVVQERDPENFVYVVDGVDMMAQHRKNLGI